METNNFFEAFNESNRLEEAGVVGTAAKNLVNAAGNKIANSKIGQKVKNSKAGQLFANAKDQINQQNTNDANSFAETYKALKGEDGKSGILGELQAIANESANFEDIDDLIKRINAIQSLNNSVKKQINQMLNQQKAALQQKEQPANNQQNNDEKPVENPQDVEKDETTTDAKNPQQQTEQKGNAANVPEGNRNAIKVKLQGIAKELGQSEDDIIAYIKTL